MSLSQFRKGDERLKGVLKKDWLGIKCYACGKSPHILYHCQEHDRLECKPCYNEERADADEIARKAKEVMRLLDNG